ncbi:Conserved_hypothetical protein [Hexamita inflata]|uniref:Transmembrane protein n=1 Tax=Hexamita inflata TaxID=28002 RepID=A0AA86RCM0_9EUKA|nr:Conserved hypothetical protein [Hexamita inflata]
MFTLLIYTLNELDRLEKQVLFNCFDQYADINIFSDSSDIYLTINAIPSDCYMPYGVLVSVQLNSLAGYEPQVYLEDFEYGQTKLIIVKCDNPSCANLKASSAGIIVMESKTEVTYIHAGSVQISRGRSSNCFNDNDSYVELYQGSIVAVLYPTFRCINTITTTQGQQLVLNTPLKAKVYITYTDNSITIHDQLIITVENPIFVPLNEFSSDSVPVKVRLAHPDISQYFEQKITNGTITKDMVSFQLQFYFTTGQQIIKISQTTVNYYELLGIQDAFESIQLIFLSNGFAVKKQTSQNAAAGNTYLTSLGVDSYQIEYTFVTYDVERTNEFRFRLIAQGLNNGQFDNQPIINNCNLRFPNQGCDELMKKLQSWDLSELTPSITQFFYAGNQLVTNYSKFVNEFLDSCFSTGHLDYDNQTETLAITINQNDQSKFCTLLRNDVLTVEISLGNNSQQLTSLIIDYIPGIQKYTLTGFNLSLHPEIRIQYFRSGEFQDAVSLTDYVIKVNDGLIRQELITILFVLSANLGVTVIYVLFVVIAVPAFLNKTNKPRMKEIKMDEDP